MILPTLETGSRPRWCITLTGMNWHATHPHVIRVHTSTVTQSEQIFIHILLPRKLGFGQGTKIVVTETDSDVEVHPFNAHYFEQHAGVLSGDGEATLGLSEERQADKVCEHDRFR